VVADILHANFEPQPGALERAWRELMARRGSVDEAGAARENLILFGKFACPLDYDYLGRSFAHFQN